MSSLEILDIFTEIFRGRGVEVVGIVTSILIFIRRALEFIGSVLFGTGVRNRLKEEKDVRHLQYIAKLASDKNLSEEREVDLRKLLKKDVWFSIYCEEYCLYFTSAYALLFFNLYEEIPLEEISKRAEELLHQIHINGYQKTKSNLKKEVRKNRILCWQEQIDIEIECLVMRFKSWRGKAKLWKS